MLLFLFGIILLIAGFFTYGKFIERILAPDHRDTPAKIHHDGVDFVVNPRFEGKPTKKASSIIAFGEGGEVKIIRE